MKVAVVADLHLHPFARFATLSKDGLNSWVSEGLDLLEQVYHYCEENFISELWILGDLFHVGNRVNTAVFNTVRRRLLHLHNRTSPLSPRLRLIPGNHDYADRLGKESIVYGLSDVIYVHHASVLEDWRHACHVVFVPYTENYTLLREWLKGTLSLVRKKPVILAGHLGVEGAAVGRFEYQPFEEMKCSDFSDISFTILGHYHKRQFLTENVMYCGSLRALDFSDAGQEKGLNILNVSDEGKVDVKFVPLESTRFEVFDADGEPIAVTSSIVRTIVRVDYSSSLDEDACRRGLIERGARAVVFNKQSATQIVNRVESSVEGKEPTLRDYLTTYVDERKGDLDGGRLLKKGLEFVQGESDDTGQQRSVG